MPSIVSQRQSVVLLLAKELAEQLAPDEAAFFDDFVKDLNNKRKSADPLAFGLSDATLFLTPHLLHACEYAGTAMWALGCAVATDVSKDLLKERLKTWLQRRPGIEATPSDRQLLPFRSAIESTEERLRAAGLDANRSRELSLTIVASLFLATDAAGEKNGRQA